MNSSVNRITPGYFEAMGMHVIAGRDFTWSDDSQKPRRAIVNQAFVRHFFPSGDAMGKLFGNDGADGLAGADNEIIGVVSDAKYRSLREEIPPTVYQPMLQGFDSAFVLHVRTHGRPELLIAPVQAALRSLDRELPFIEVNTLREEVETSLWQERLLATLSSVFACFAASLTAIGLYGAVDFMVKSRTREIGVRMALGADPARLVRLLTAQTALVVTAGSVAGMAICVISARWIRVVLYGAAPAGTTAALPALLLVTGIALVSTVAPLWRAVHVDPATALRHQ